VSTLVKDVEAEDWSKLLTDGEQAYEDVMAAASACNNTQTLFDSIVKAVLDEVTLPAGADKAKCEADIDAMYPDVEQLIKDIEAGDDNKILVDALKIYNAIESSMTDCLGKSLSTMEFVEKLSVERSLATESAQCQSLQTCFSGCPGLAEEVNCNSLNKLQCQKLKQRAKRLAGV